MVAVVVVLLVALMFAFCLYVWNDHQWQKRYDRLTRALVMSERPDTSPTLTDRKVETEAKVRPLKPLGA